jgi:uncharacterized protein
MSDKINMFIGIIKKDTLITSNWAGGTTTQLLIYPEEGNYSKRDFKWRVSTAKVEVQESTFTSLPGISRIIMILEGCLKIQHYGHHNMELNPYEIDEFEGEWVTKGFGKVTDFNLMMGEGVKGELGYIKITPFQKKEILLEDDNKLFENVANFYYCPYRNIGIMINEVEYRLNAGDIIYITSRKLEMKLEFINDCEDDIMVVRGKVLY